MTEDKIPYLAHLPPLVLITIGFFFWAHALIIAFNLDTFGTPDLTKGTIIIVYLAGGSLLVGTGFFMDAVLREKKVPQ